MNITYFDAKKIKGKEISDKVDALSEYRTFVDAVVLDGIEDVPEYALAQAFEEEMLQSVHAVVSNFKKPRHVVLVGIGGSSLGVEAVHSVCANSSSPQLHVLDTVSAHEMESVLLQLSKVKKVSEVAVCVISKSGKTTETLANAEILLGSLREQFGESIYKQTVFVGDPNTPLVNLSKKMGCHYINMSSSVGGRFSVFTPVGLVPLMLLGHDIEAFLSGLVDAATETYEEVVADSAARISWYAQQGIHDYNIFVFDTRLVRLGKWCRQLMAESLGKSRTSNNKKNTATFLPTITTPVELHSIGQLYFSDVLPVYTDFISFDDEDCDYQIPGKAAIAKNLVKKSMQEISAAMYAGVVTSYQESKLSYRSTIFDEDRLYSVGLFMAMRMRETMYAAQILSLNAFDQPNVELYKEHTAAFLKTKAKK